MGLVGWRSWDHTELRRNGNRGWKAAMYECALYCIYHIQRISRLPPSGMSSRAPIVTGTGSYNLMS